MRFAAFVLSCGLACCMPGGTVRAAAPIDLSKVASVDDLAAEAQAKLNELDEQLKDDATYEKAKEKSIGQAAGVLAVLGQALAEHPEKGQALAKGADLRDAALRIDRAGSREEAAAALADAKKAAAGQSAGAAAGQHEWNKLINMHRLMEEVNARNSKIRRVLRRPQDPREDSLHAMTLAVLALVIYADTHEVKNEGDLPAWREHSKAFQSNMTGAAAALKQNDTKKANGLFLEANKACNTCHEQFRKK